MKILNFGSLNLDNVYQVPHFLQAGETMAALSEAVHPGGKGLNQSLALARAGAEVYHAGVVGNGSELLTNLLKENGMAYLPFVGKVSGSPSILEGTNEEIIQNAKDLMAKGIKGFDILAYRHVVDGEKLAREFCAAIDAEICIAGSINSYARIDTMFDIGPWTFTMGSALFEKKFVADGSFRDNLKAVADYMAAK